MCKFHIYSFCRFNLTPLFPSQRQLICSLYIFLRLLLIRSCGFEAKSLASYPSLGIHELTSNSSSAHRDTKCRVCILLDLLSSPAVTPLFIIVAIVVITVAGVTFTTTPLSPPHYYNLSEQRRRLSKNPDQTAPLCIICYHP